MENMERFCKAFVFPSKFIFNLRHICHKLTFFAKDTLLLENFMTVKNEIKDIIFFLKSFIRLNIKA